MLMQVYGKEKKTFRSTSNFEIKQCFFLFYFHAPRKCFFVITDHFEEYLKSVHDESFLPLS